MKRYIFLAMFIAMALGIQAQYYMNLWYNDTLLKLPVLTIDSVTFTDYIPDDPQGPELPTEPTQIDALFSVGEGIVVSFSPGNLQYHPVNNTWRFAENQWDYVGEANANISATYDGWIDLFGWGTGDNPLKTSMNGDDYQTFVDWGTNQIGNDAPNTWRTLTKDEWMCLLYYRTNAESLFALGQVNGVNGLIILPDRWSTPEEVTFVPSTQQGLVWDKRYYSNAAADNFAHNVYTLEQWAIMQNAGAVFIPAAGNRKGTNTFYVNEIGYCWSSTKYGVTYAYNLLFGSTTLDLQRANYLYYAFPVRLAKNMVYVPDDQGISTTGTENGYEWVDLGLLSGVKWATCNVGANSPEEYGDYFAWGEVEPKDEYSWSTYKWCDGRADALTKYNDQSSYGATDYKNFLDVEDDAAAVNLGGTWRTPTKMEFEELHGQCSWNWTTINGVDGYQVVGPNGNSIFLPAAGMYCDNDLGSFNIGSWGYYWTSLLDFSMNAYSSIFNNSSHYCYRNYTRIDGFPVRAVCNATNEEVPEEPVEPEEPDTPTEPEEPTNPSAGIGVFSVSADKQVAFSPGNLQYHPANDEWRFAESQTDYIGADNANISADYDGWLDLFGWSTSSTNFGVSTSTDYNDYSGSFVDWGTNQIGADAPNTWRTLTGDEWNYLLKNRPNASSLCGVAQVSGVNGLILLPDTWVCPEGISGFTPGFVEWEGEGYNQHQQLGPDTWAALEASGAIFLPAAGQRSGGSVGVVNKWGFYWSALTAYHNSSAYYLRIEDCGISMSQSSRDTGFSVRLVKDIEGGGATPDTPDTPDPEPEPDPIEPYKSIGIFTVGEGKAISFAPGNLQYTQSTNTWSFAENQWEFIGDANVENENLANNIDMFGWSTDNAITPFGISTSGQDADYYGSFVDWGTNQIGNDAPNTWRTLSNEEWVYLIEKRSRAERLYGIAQVANVNGFILLPDNWDNSINLAFNFKYGLSPTFSYSDHQSFTAEQWEILESLGAVFLPAYGRRQGTNVYGGKYGSYWSSTALSDAYAYDIEFGPNRIYPNYSDCHFYGQFVRLVKDIVTNETPDTPDTPENTENGYEYVDLGLSVKWATCNVGASKPEEYGDYFAWGEVEPKDTYDWSTYKWCEGSNTSLTKYCIHSNDGSVDNKTTLEATDDAATANWGGSWRMPTEAEFQELSENCTWTWKIRNGIGGFEITSNKEGYTYVSIFIPAAGHMRDSALKHMGDGCNYWSSTLFTYGLESYSAKYLSIYYWHTDASIFDSQRYFGRSVRPVCQ